MQSHEGTVIQYITQANGGIDHLESRTFSYDLHTFTLGFLYTFLCHALCRQYLHYLHNTHLVLAPYGWLQVVNGEVF